MIPLRTTGRAPGEESLWQRVVSWDLGALAGLAGRLLVGLAFPGLV